MKEYLLLRDDYSIITDAEGNFKVYNTGNILNHLFGATYITLYDRRLIAVNDYTKYTQTPKIQKINKVSTIKQLIVDGANPKANEDDFFVWACAFYSKSIIKYLLQFCDINTQKGLPLTQAVSEGRLDIVKFLVENGADIHADDDTPVFYSVFRGNTKNLSSILKYLVEADKFTEHMNYAFQHACEIGNYEVVSYLLKKGADVNYDYGCALKYAAMNGHVKIVKLLIDNGIDLKEYGEMAITWAKKDDKPQAVIKLIKKEMEKIK